MKLKLSEIARSHPLLQSGNLEGVASYWHQHQNDYLLAEFMPLVNEDTDKIEVDMTKQERGGMTPMVSMVAESPIHDPAFGRGRREFEAATFREKVKVMADEVYDLREIGTREGLETARRLLSAKIRSLEVRLANRLEWMRREVIFDNEIVAELEDGTEFKVEYKHPDYLDPVTGTSFDDYDNSEPIIVLQDVLEDYELDTGRSIDEAILPHGMMKHFLQSERFLQLARDNFSAFRGTSEEIRRLIVELVGLPNISESRDFIQMQTDLTADADEGTNTLQLRSVPMLEEGDKLYICSVADNDRDKVEVASIDGKTVTLDTNLSRDFKVGDPVKYKREIIPQDTILMFGEWEGRLSDEGELHPDKIEDPNRWGEVVSTRSHYADIENPRPGLYNRVRDETEGDPPHLEYILGIRALPRVVNPEGWVTLKALL